MESKIVIDFLRVMTSLRRSEYIGLRCIQLLLKSITRLKTSDKAKMPHTKTPGGQAASAKFQKQESEGRYTSDVNNVRPNTIFSKRYQRGQ